MGMIGGNPSVKMAGLGSRFQYEEYKYMISEAQEEYALASAGSAYEQPGQQEPMGLMP